MPIIALLINSETAIVFKDTETGNLVSPTDILEMLATRIICFQRTSEVSELRTELRILGAKFDGIQETVGMVERQIRFTLVYADTIIPLTKVGITANPAETA